MVYNENILGQKSSNRSKKRTNDHKPKTPSNAGAGSFEFDRKITELEQ